MPEKTEEKIVPANQIGILPLQEAVLFPHTVIPLAVVKKPGIALVEEALREGKPIGLVVLRDREIEDPGPDDIQRVGVCRGFSDGGENTRLVPGGDFARGVRIYVKNAGELDLSGFRQVRVNAGVILSQRTDAQNGHSDL